MKKQIISFTLIAVGFLIGASALSALAVGSWSAPTAPPPGGSPDAPLNTGSLAQTKTGLLGLSSLLFNPTGTANIATGSVLTALDTAGDVGWSAGGTGDYLVGSSAAYKAETTGSVTIPIVSGADYAIITGYASNVASGGASTDVNEDAGQMQITVNLDNQTTTGIHALVGGDSVDQANYVWSNQPFGSQVTVTSGNAGGGAVGSNTYVRFSQNAIRPAFAVSGSNLIISDLPDGGQWVMSFMANFYRK